MFASRLPRSLPSLASSSRRFSTTIPAAFKLPSLGDVTHSEDHVQAYIQRSTDYKESHRLKPTPKASASVKDSGLIRGLIYGSEKGQAEEAEMEQSYSKVLARGKYVHAIEIHHVKPDKHKEYMDLIGKAYPEIAGRKENECHLVGSWKSEIGDMDTFVHIWEYNGYAGYHQTLSNVAKTPVNDLLKEKLPSLLTARRTDLMQEFAFWATAAPRKLGGIFELRTYTLYPGKLLEWEEHWRAGLNARKKVMDGAGAWFNQVGLLNTVHHLWQFPDLRQRQIARENSWHEQGWNSTVHKTLPLIKTMESKVLVPLPWSPLS